MTEHTGSQRKPPVEAENENAALSSALSLHYIVLVIYALATLGGAAVIIITGVVGDAVSNGDLLMTILPLILFSLHLLAVKGLNKGELWGYNTSKILAYLLLLGFPFGTVLGLILLSQLKYLRSQYL